jgi:hypothetical protein
MSPLSLGTKNDYAGEDQQQFNSQSVIDRNILYVLSKCYLEYCSDKGCTVDALTARIYSC